MKPYEHPAYSDPVVSNEEPDRDCHEWNFEPGDSDQEPYPEYHGANTEEDYRRRHLIILFYCNP